MVFSQKLFEKKCVIAYHCMFDVFNVQAMKCALPCTKVLKLRSL